MRRDTEDEPREPFCQLSRPPALYDGRSGSLTLTLGVADNVCGGVFRQCSRGRVGPRAARNLADGPVEASRERRVEAPRVLEKCDAILERSRRPAPQDIFHLRYGESHSIREIAEKVGKSNEAVQVSLRRSPPVLADNLPEPGIIPDNAAQRA